MSARAAIIVPVRDGGALVDAALPALEREAAESGAVLIVVDDGSAVPVETSAAVTLLRNEVPVGPYAARNQAWRSTDAAVVVFTDMRCVPEAGWAEALISAVEDGAPLAGGAVTVTDGDRGAAARAARRYRTMDVGGPLGHPFLPYLACCNLAVERRLLEELDGFDARRSGGDADLCWRAQLQGTPPPRVVEGAGVAWTPRSTLRELCEQYYRYGWCAVDLAERYSGQGAPAVPIPRPRFVARMVGRFVIAVVRSDDRPAAVYGVIADGARGWGQWRRGHGRAT